MTKEMKLNIGYRDLTDKQLEELFSKLFGLSEGKIFSIEKIRNSQSTQKEKQ